MPALNIPQYPGLDIVTGTYIGPSGQRVALSAQDWLNVKAYARSQGIETSASANGDNRNGGKGNDEGDPGKYPDGGTGPTVPGQDPSDGGMENPGGSTGGGAGNIPGGPQTTPPPAPGNGAPPSAGNGGVSASLASFLEMLKQSGQLDIAAQRLGLTNYMQDRSDSTGKMNYLDSLYGGDVLGVKFDKPQVSLDEYLNGYLNGTGNMGGVGGSGGGGGTVTGGPNGNGGTVGAGSPMNGGAPNMQVWGRTPQSFGAGLGNGDFATGAKGEIDPATGERIGHYTDSGRQKINANHRRVAAAFKYGETLNSLGITDQKENGATMNELWKPGGFYSKYGINAGETWIYTVKNGTLMKKPYPNQPGRIKDWGKDFKAVGGKEQASYEKMQNFLAENPGAGASDFLSYKRLANSVRGPNNKIKALEGRPGYFVDGGGQVFDHLGRKVEALTNQGQWQGAGLGPDDINPAWPGPNGGFGNQMANGGVTPNVSGEGGFTQLANAYNPNNPNSWGLLAAPASQIAGGLDANKKALMEAMPAGGERDRALSDAINNSYSQVGGLKQGLVNDALNYVNKSADQLHFGTPLTSYSGGAGTGASAQNTATGQNLSYDLGLKNIAAGNQQASNGMWGQIGSSLGGLLSSPGFWGGMAMLGSDERVKEDISAHKGGLDKILEMKVYDWEYNGKGGTTKGLRASGVMAQDLEKILPEAVVKRPDAELGEMRLVNYAAILATSLNAIKDLDKKIKKLEKAA